MKLIYGYRHVWVFLAWIALAGLACQPQASPHANHEQQAAEVYTCPMHPEIIRSQPGSCPVCGMDLVKKEPGGTSLADLSLEALLRPTNEFVLSSVRVIAPEQRELPVEVEVPGTIAYDTRQTGIISSRTAGRVERLYVRYQYQAVARGQRIMDLYSPELMTAQQNLLFILKNDLENATLIDAARHRLLLLGMSEVQVQRISKSGKPLLSVPVYSQYSGHIHETTPSGGMAGNPASLGDAMSAAPLSTTQPLTLKEGMYVQKGQSVFTVYNPSRLWALLSIPGEEAALVKVGNAVRITPEAAPAQNFRAHIDFIEPFFRPGSKTLTARVYFTNRRLGLPVGSQVRATIFTGDLAGGWLPREAVLTLGMDKVVFRKEGNGFRAHRVETGMQQSNLVQITRGLSPTDSVAQNAQFLIDNESFIKVTEQ